MSASALVVVEVLWPFFLSVKGGLLTPEAQCHRMINLRHLGHIDRGWASQTKFSLTS